jgi:hypothetical protein
MSPSWLWCLKIGAAVVLIDVAVLVLGQSQGPDSDLRGFLDTLDLTANVMLFAYAGYRTGLQTGRATAAAEAGVIASLLPALVAAVLPVVEPGLAGSAEPTPLLNRIVGAIAFNIVLGGISAWLSGWIASRRRPSTR